VRSVGCALAEGYVHGEHRLWRLNERKQVEAVPGDGEQECVQTGGWRTRMCRWEDEQECVQTGRRWRRTRNRKNVYRWGTTRQVVNVEQYCRRKDEETEW
jgi:hypothetical protein